MPQHDWQQPDNRGSDDWAPGDLALCLKNFQKWGVRRGGVYTVVMLEQGILTSGRSGLGLHLGERPIPARWAGFDASCFRKIRPLSDEGKQDFRAMLGHEEHLADLVRAYGPFKTI